MNTHLITKLNQPSKAQLALPFYNLLPKDEVGLLKWRIYVRERCLHDLEFRNQIRMMCSKDIAFFAATFIWLHETRQLAGQALGKFPLFPDCDQVDLLAWLAANIGAIDITCSKTRGIGLSYLICIVLLWLWLFHGEQLEFAVVTKDETSLDQRDRPSSFMGKLDLLFDNLPSWLKVDSNGNKLLDRTVTKHRFQNLSNGNIIGGYVATDDKLRSGRFYCVILDEAAFLPADVQRWIAAAHGTTNSIVWISTFDGTSNMFYRISVDDCPTRNIVRIETWWTANPRWAAGMYVSKNGIIEYLDPTYKYEPDYPYSHDDPGMLRSPMVDAAFNRPGADKQRVKEEIYGITIKDSRKLFSRELLALLQRSITPPVWSGDIFDGEWIEDEEGPIKLWVLPANLTGVYALGADPGLGQYAKAGLAAIDIKTGLTVLTARFEGMDCITFANKSIEVCKALCGPRGSGYARLAWESTGIGGAYSSEIKRLRWPAVWTEPGKATPGCHNSDRGEAWLLELGRALSAKDGIIRCRDALNDFEAWEYDRNYNLIFASTDGHGDLGMAIAIAWRAAKERREAIIKTDKQQRTVVNEIAEENRRQRNQHWSSKFELPKTRGRQWL